MLQCLVAAVRPLYVEELAELLAFEFDVAQGGIPKYHSALRLDDQTQAVLSTCSSLVTIINERWSGRQVVQFSHFSVKEFLVSNRLAPPSLGNISRYHICLGPAHTTLTQACLGLLLHSDDHVMKEILDDSPLADYAARHWVEHAQFEDVASCVKDGMETLFDLDKPHFEAWVGRYNIDWRVRRLDISEGANPLYYAVLCGFYDLVEHLAIKHPQYVNSFGGNCRFPLLAALGQGHVEVAELLLKHGTDIDVREAKGRTILLVALTWFTFHDNLPNIVEFLLTHGADVNARDATFTSSLHLAAEYGMRQVLEILLKHRADVNSQDNNDRTPLHILSGSKFYEDILLGPTLLLMEHGAEVDKRDMANQTPLHLAIHWNRFRLTGILLEHGADSNAETNEGMTPLHILSQLECDIEDEDEILNFVPLLLKHGAEVNRRNKYNETPMHLAIRWGWFKLAGILLENGADSNAEDNQGMTPLHIIDRKSVV